MVGPCLCVNLTKAVRLVALASMILGIGVAATSSWILHRSTQARKSPTLATASQFISQVNTYFGGTTGLYDLDVIFRILISASMSAMVGGGLQFLMSFWLLMASVKTGGGRIMARIWVVIHVVIMLAIGGGCLCILTNELEINPQVKIFLATTGADALLIIYFCFVVYSYSYGTYDKDGGVSTVMKEKEGLFYAQAPPQSPPPTMPRQEPTGQGHNGHGIGMGNNNLNGALKQQFMNWSRKTNNTEATVI